MGTSEYVFKEGADGSLEPVFDFNRLYQDVTDPWDQSGTSSAAAMSAYYRHSRHRLASVLKRVMSVYAGPVLEVGCGHGHVVDYLSKELPYATIEGIDISSMAIMGAYKRYPHRRFRVSNILENYTHPKQCVVILNQVLWYIAARLDDALNNCAFSLEENGYLVISQAFLKSGQRYMPELDFNGLLRRMLDHKEWQVVGVEYDCAGNYKHHDGLLVFRCKAVECGAVFHE